VQSKNSSKIGNPAGPPVSLFFQLLPRRSGVISPHGAAAAPVSPQLQFHAACYQPPRASRPAPPDPHPSPFYTVPFLVLLSPFFSSFKRAELELPLPRSSSPPNPSNGRVSPRRHRFSAPRSRPSSAGAASSPRRSVSFRRSRARLPLCPVLARARRLPAPPELVVAAQRTVKPECRHRAPSTRRRTGRTLLLRSASRRPKPKSPEPGVRHSSASPSKLEVAAIAVRRSYLLRSVQPRRAAAPPAATRSRLLHAAVPSARPSVPRATSSLRPRAPTTPPFGSALHLFPSFASPSQRRVAVTALVGTGRHGQELRPC
jgi:hypothetical protein